MNCFGRLQETSLPISFPSAFLLHLLRVHIDMARLRKVAWEMLSGSSSSVGESDVITVILLVGASHCTCQ